MARSLALVSDPAAPRSVVGVIGPAFRAVNANRQQIVAQWIMEKKSSDSSQLGGRRVRRPVPHGKKSQKKFAPLGAPEGLRRRSWAPLPGGPRRPAVQ